MSRPYGRRPPYRDRMGVRAFLSLIAFGGIFGAAVVLSSRGHADPVEPEVAVYAARNAGPVCQALDDHPSIPGLNSVLASVMGDGFTATESGQIVALAVQARCPQFLPLLQQFVALHSPKGVAA